MGTAVLAGAIDGRVRDCRTGRDRPVLVDVEGPGTSRVIGARQAHLLWRGPDVPHGCGNPATDGHAAPLRLTVAEPFPARPAR